MKKIAIDLTWVRHGKVGGTESCIRNLLDGFAEYPNPEIKFVLLLAKDNKDSFEKYKQYNNFESVVVNTISASQRKRVMWQNFQMGKELRKLGVKICLEPIYGKPFLGTRGIDFITTIHDLQAYHYPEYFSKARVIWMKLSWWNAVHTSKYVIAISNFVKEDILSKYHVDSSKVTVIYDVVDVDVNECKGKDELSRYNVQSYQYYYTVSSLLPHKNLSTLIEAMGILKQQKSSNFYPLIISGVGGKSKNELNELIRNYNLENDVIFTPFVNNCERNTLYKYCKAFLFPSIFEGFGMPPIEAMLYARPVITTTKTSLYEMTEGECNYVDNPLDCREWASVIQREYRPIEESAQKKLSEKYNKHCIVKKYYELIEGLK